MADEDNESTEDGGMTGTEEVSERLGNLSAALWSTLSSVKALCYISQ